MSIKRITAILPLEIITPMEAHLRVCGVPGVTVERAKGYGKHPNYFRRDFSSREPRTIGRAFEWIRCKQTVQTN